MSSPLDNVTPDEALLREEWWQRKHSIYTDRVFRFILTYLDLPGKLAEARQHAHELTGSRLLDTSIFMHVMPEFPVWLGVRWITRVREDLQADKLWKRYGKTRQYQRWAEVAADKPEHWDGALGIAFAMPGHRGGSWTFIQHDLPVDLPDGGYWQQKKLKGRLMTLEPLVQFLDRLRN